MPKNHLHRLALTLVVLIVIAASALAAASAHTASSLSIITVNSDSLRNYDFKSQSVSASNVDWPIGLIFSNNATINKVKSGLDGFYGVGSVCADAMQGRINDGAGWVWDSDSGKKSQCCPISGDAYHFRVYADSDDQLYNVTWGFYVVGSTHIDHAECGGDAWSGLSENAEGILRARAPSTWTKFPNNYWFNNYEYLRVDGGDYMYNDGWASKLRVP